MFTNISLAVFLAVSSAMGYPDTAQPAWDTLYNDWRPAGPDDSRAPCPMLNSLANHGFLPHSGRHITRDELLYAMGTALNFDPEIINLTFDAAITANPTPNATWFDLWHLGRPDVLEHDASLSRRDAYFGNASVFDQSSFDQTKSYWKGDTLDPLMLTNSKIGRQLQSRVDNPTYRFTEKTEGFSTGEMTSFVIALGDWETVTAPRNFVEYFFENERLPTALGWTPPKEVITRTVVRRFDKIFTDAQSLITDEQGKPFAIAAEQVSKRGVHAAY